MAKTKKHVPRGAKLPKLTGSNHVRADGGLYFSRNQVGGEGLDPPPTELTNRRIGFIIVGVIVMAGLIAAIFVSGVFTPPNPTPGPAEPTNEPGPSPTPPPPGPVPPPPVPPPGPPLNPPSVEEMSVFDRYVVPALGAVGALAAMGLAFVAFKRFRRDATPLNAEGVTEKVVDAHKDAWILGALFGGERTARLANEIDEQKNAGTLATTGYTDIHLTDSSPNLGQLSALARKHPSYTRSLRTAYNQGAAAFFVKEGVKHIADYQDFSVPSDLGGPGNAKFRPLGRDEAPDSFEYVH